MDAYPMDAYSPHVATEPGRARAIAWGLAIGLACYLAVAATGLTSSAAAAACSTSTGAVSCTINASLTVTAGTLTLESSPNLYWGIVQTGYDQWASGSATPLTSCAASGATTTCSSGTKPTLLVLDATGSGSGWALSEYLTANTLPTGYVLKFNGAGSATIGNSTSSPIATDPFAATTPTNICDFGSGCTAATAASTCSHAPLGFSTCPSYAVTLGGTSASTQVDLYSATAATGLGAICFASGSATGTGCAGATPTDFYNLGVKGNSAVGTNSATINVAVNSGP
jgi:hypothetical protein